MKVGDLVRRGKAYKPKYRQEVALVIDAADDHPDDEGRGPCVRLFWPDGINSHVWYPCDLMVLIG